MALNNDWFKHKSWLKLNSRNNKKRWNTYMILPLNNVFEPGDQVLVLRPLICAPFKAKFDSPYSTKWVTWIMWSSHQVGKKPTKLYHINLLKPFY